MNTRIFTILAAALAAGFCMNARADDSSLSPFGGDGYDYFREGMSRAGAAPTTLHRDNPKDTSVREYQALSSWAPAWHPAPAADRTPATFRTSNATGLSLREYQALSSNSQVWQLSGSSGNPLSAPINATQAARSER
jgi:hypothetical protein